jgi:site-specific DNA recombinase
VKRDEPKSLRRCAIYTRVSTESGLEQDFNSLDSQREACEAYIRSQAHEGWRAVRERFDDGGFSGGSMDRPALQKLLGEVRGRRIDVIVVYKVDRLTRSLADFAKLVETFDAHEVSFISVTQAFNTTTSMGRLTLNMLLSFAQFEREITGERIRDKIAASKRKGIWMGGAVPLGYRVENRALHVVEGDAAFMRDLFRRYLELGSVVRLQAALDKDNIRLPRRHSPSGKAVGGGPAGRGQLYALLSNPIYVGKLRHKGQIHDGLHEAIVDRYVWDRAQAKLAEQTPSRNGYHNDDSFLLAGKLFDDRGNRMGTAYAAKGSRRWRYYVSRAVLRGQGHDAGSIRRAAAPEIERAVLQALRRAGQGGAADGPRPEASLSSKACKAGSDQPAAPVVSSSASHPPSDQALIDKVERIIATRRSLEIRFGAGDAIEAPTAALFLPWTPPSPHRLREILLSDEIVRTSVTPMRTTAQTVLVESLAKAHLWLDQLVIDPTESIAVIAQREGKSERSIRMTLSLAFIDPRLIRAAVERRLPRGFGVKRLTDLPMLWSAQWDAVGLRAPARE